MRPREIERLGDGIAAATHDLNNVLAVVRESAGLVRDLVEAGRMDRAETLRRALAAVDRQVDRAETVTRRLNRLAHLLDRPRDGLDADGLADLVVFLSARTARARHVTLEREGTCRERVPGAAPALLSDSRDPRPPRQAGGGRDPARIVLSAAALVERVIAALRPGAALSLRTESVSRRPALHLGAVGAGIASLATPLAEELGESLAELGLELRADGVDALRLLL